MSDHAKPFLRTTIFKLYFIITNDPMLYKFKQSTDVSRLEYRTLKHLNTAQIMGLISYRLQNYNFLKIYASL